ncbi:MAG: FHIPEP family type III secretion protein [Treponema sp.]|jgi:flagellar biosynthesis protein FlhA|nr:FHIPEP family type III secretion protein [Treponema sp.]
MKIHDSLFMAQTAERIKMLFPYIAASDIIIAGREELAIGLRYDDENMFAPIIIIMEQKIPLEAVKEAASGAGVPYVQNDALAGNLFSYGKLGEAIPDLCCRDIAAIIGRNGKRPSSTAGQIKKEPVKQKRPIRIEFGITLMAFLGGKTVPADSLSSIQKKLSRLFGYSFPHIGLAENPRLKGGEYRILFKALEVGRGIVELNWYKTVDLGLDPAQLDFAAKTTASAIAAHVEELLQKRACELLGRDEVQAILDRAEKKYPVVTGEVKSLLSLGSIRDLLRGLISENVSIRHIQVILETLADWGSFGPAPNEIIIEQIRQSLKRQICLDYTDEKQTLRALTLDNKLEQIFSERASIHERCINSGISPDEWLDAFSPAIRSMEERGLKPVVLCSPAARSWLKELTRMKFPNLAVLSYIEIPQDINVVPVGEISVKDSISKEQGKKSGRRLG